MLYWHNNLDTYYWSASHPRILLFEVWLLYHNH